MTLESARHPAAAAVAEPTVTVEIDPHREIGRLDDNVFGHFLESAFFGNIDGGVFDEQSPYALPGPAPAGGLRADVIDACRALGVPVVRWPGGNFTSAYRWGDGVGPRDARPRRLELAWGGEESNRFGTDEFLTWCQAIGAQPYLVHSARDVEEAARWVEYTNYTGQTTLSRARAANGHPGPWGVRYWGVGNEVYGPWQMGHRSAEAYAADAREHAVFMRRVDPTIQLIAVGAPPPQQERWARALFARAGDLFDFVSLHLYGASLHLGGTDDYEAVVTQPRYFEDEIASCSEVLSTVARELGIERRLSIALDEWNIRHLEPAAWPAPVPGERGGTAARGGHADGVRGLAPEPGDGPPGDWRVNRYSSRTLADALFYAGVFHALYRQAGREVPVRMANTVNLVNANALLEVRPGGLVRSATYHVWDLYQNHLGRRVVPARVSGPRQSVAVRRGAVPAGQGFPTVTSSLPLLDVVATSDGDGRSVRAAVINRHRSLAVSARLVSTVSGGLPPRAHVWDLGAGVADVWAVNDLDHPDAVSAVDRGEIPLGEGGYRFGPHSLTLLRWST
jgi:alpha-N-arabinofuranosidase